MAKRGAGRVPLIVFGVLSVIALAAGAWVILGDVNRSSEAEKAVAALPPTLPQGPLKLARGGMTESRFVAIDTVRPAAGGGLEATVVLVGRAPTSLEGGTAFMSKRQVVDCVGQRLYEGQVGYFDVAGKLRSATNAYSGKRGRPFEPSDAETAYVCDIAKRTGRVFDNVRVAQRELQTMPEGYAKVVATNREDAHGWAWLCSAAARGVWRRESPKDCERALVLAPKDTGLRVDRGFLNLITGKNAAANADFRRVMTEAPDNAAALFGHSLILAMSGDRAASRPLRLRALDLEPRIAEWIEANYRFFIDVQFRGR